MALIISQLSRQICPPFPWQGCTHPLQPARLPSFLLLLPLPSPSLLSPCSNLDNSHLPSLRSPQLMAWGSAVLCNSLMQMSLAGPSSAARLPAGRGSTQGDGGDAVRQGCSEPLCSLGAGTNVSGQCCVSSTCGRGILEVSHPCSRENPSSSPRQPVAGALPCQLECQGAEAGC